MKSRPPELLEAYAEICRSRGALCGVGPASYQRFIELSDDIMEGLLCLVIFNSMKTVIEWMEDPETHKCPQDIEDYLETQLHLVAGGFLRFDPDGQMVCVQPEGPLPTAKEMKAIELRILSSRRLMKPARNRLFDLFPDAD